MYPELISGISHTDQRGKLEFFNELDLRAVVRMYRITPADTLTIRAWQGHRKESKWFFCLKGSFVVNLIPLPQFQKESASYSPEIYTLHADTPKVLKIPGGYANGFRAFQADSELLVFSDKNLEESGKDEIRYGLDQIRFTEPK